MKVRLSGLLGRSLSEIGELSEYELQQYGVAEDLEPWGERRADYRAAMIVWAIVCSNSRNPPPFAKILEMFDFRPKAGEQGPEQIEMIFEQVAAASK